MSISIMQYLGILLIIAIASGIIIGITHFSGVPMAEYGFLQEANAQIFERQNGTKIPVAFRFRVDKVSLVIVAMNYTKIIQISKVFLKSYKSAIIIRIDQRISNKI